MSPEENDLRQVNPSDLPPAEPAPSKSGRKYAIITAAIVLLLLAGGLAYWFLLRDAPAATDQNRQPVSQKGTAKDDGKLRLIATGDMIAHDSINENAKQADGSYNYLSLMSRMKPFFDKADIRFCNQATMAGGESFGISGYPVFNAPLAFTHDLVRLGCNLVNTGTNHTNDKGQDLINAAIAEWEKQDVLAVAGANRSAAERGRVATFETGGIKFAFLSYATYTNAKVTNGYGVTMYSADLAKRQLVEARKTADIVIVSMRWGTEYSPEINESQVRLSQNLADFGADIILGHGPHVLEPVKQLEAADGRQVLVWYSLGNFLNSQLDIESLIGGFAIMDIDVATKKISAISFLPVYQHYEWTAEEKKKEDLLARHNFQMVPLDKAAELLSKSQHDTTVEEQTERVKNVLNDFTEVSIIPSNEY